jgi:PAS domain S-box-containing protein
MTENNSNLLIGWKQIAAYLRCASSTARRQARGKGLPVFRVGGSVRAHPADIDRWLEAQPRPESTPGAGAAPQALIVGGDELPTAVSNLGGRAAGHRYAVFPLGVEEEEFARIQQLLRSAEEKYQRLVEQVPAWIWETNAVGEFTYSNPRSRQILGYDPGDFTGFAPTEFAVAPEDAENFGRSFGAVRRRGSVMKGFRCRFVHRDGSRRWLETDAEPAFDAAGEFAGVRGVSRDVTEVVQAEAARQEAHERLTATLDALPDILFEVDRNGRIYDYRAADKENLHALREDFLGLEAGEFLPPEAARVVREALAEAAETGSHSGGQYRLEVLEDVRWYELSIASLGDHHNPECRFIVLVRDITERKQAETELRVHRDHLEELVEARTAELREVNAGLEREIADRARAEKELEEQRNQLQTITTVTPDLLVLLDRDLVYRAVNPAFCHFTGKREEELLGRTDFDVFPQAAAEVYRRSDEEVVASGELHILEREAADADGTTWWLQVAKAPIFDAAGEVSGLLVSARDITERRMAERALAESEKKYRDIFEHSPAGIVIHQEGKVSFLNPAMVRMTGYASAEELVGRPIMEFVHPDYQVQLAEEIEVVYARGGELGELSELVMVRKDGSPLNVTSIAQTITYDGKPAVQAYALNNTERKRVEEALVRANEEWRRTFDAVPDLVALIDNEYRVLRVNEATARRAGLTPQECVGLKCYTLFHGTEEPPAFCPHAKLLEDGREHEAEFYEEHLGAHLVVTTSPIRDAEGQLAGSVHVARDATERKHAEEALRESEAKYRDLFENANDLIQSVTPEGRFLYVNRAWNETLGFDDDELSELNLFDIIHPASRPRCRESFERVLAGERLDNVEAVFVTKDGREVVVEGSASCRFDEGRPVSTRGIFRDVTARRQAERAIKYHTEALRESEERYRLLANNVSDVILTMDLSLRFTYVSPSSMPLLGYSADEITTLTLDKISTPASFKVAAKTLAEEIAREMAGTQDLKRSRTVGVELIRKDGSSVHVEAKAIFLRDPNDKAIGILAVARDVTERKQAEEALRASEERLRALFELSPEAVIVLDPQGTVLDVNVNAYAWFGLRRQDIIGKKFDVFPFVPDDVKEKTLAAFARRLAGEDIPPYELDVNTPDGGKWRLRVRGEILRNEKGEAVADLVMVSRVPLPKEAAG